MGGVSVSKRIDRANMWSQLTTCYQCGQLITFAAVLFGEDEVITGVFTPEPLVLHAVLTPICSSIVLSLLSTGDYPFVETFVARWRAPKWILKSCKHLWKLLTLGVFRLQPSGLV